MTPSSPTPIFSRWVSWLGILILGAGVVSAAPTSSVAAAPALATESLQFSAASQSAGTLSGAAPVSFSSGIAGWGAAPLSTLGPLGLEWFEEGATGRRAYNGSTESTDFTPGGASSWVGAGSLARSPRETLFVRQTVRVEGNSMRFTMALEPIDDDVLEGRRVYFSAGLAPSYASEFTGAGTSTLVATDTSHAHPTLVFHASSTKGVLAWGGADSVTDPLTNGDLTPTLYLHSTNSDDVTFSVTVGVIDRDPCSASDAATFAQSQAGVLGAVWASRTSCLQAPAWTVVADGGSNTSALETGLPLTGLPAGTSVALEFSGLPDGVTITRGTDSGTQAGFTVSASEGVTPGTYTPTITRTRRVTLAGVTTVSQPDTVTGSLTITAPPPPPPPPVSEPEEEEEPDVAPAPPAVTPESSSARSQSAPSAPIVAETTVEPAPQVTPTRPAPDVAEPEIVEPRPLPAADPEPVYVPPDPSYLPLFEPEIPEPVNAGAWLGVSLAAAALTGGLLAYLRRKKDQQE